MSDARLKEEIEPIHGALDDVMSLRGVRYKWRDKRDPSTQVGVIAQDVEKVFPELVHKNGKGIRAVNYDGLVAPLIEAVKEQQEHIDDLEKENRSLKERLARIEKKLGL